MQLLKIIILNTLFLIKLPINFYNYYFFIYFFDINCIDIKYNSYIKQSFELINIKNVFINFLNLEKLKSYLILTLTEYKEFSVIQITNNNTFDILMKQIYLTIPFVELENKLKEVVVINNNSDEHNLILFCKLLEILNILLSFEITYMRNFIQYKLFNFNTVAIDFHKEVIENTQLFLKIKNLKSFIFKLSILTENITYLNLGDWNLFISLDAVEFDSNLLNKTSKLYLLNFFNYKDLFYDFYLFIKLFNKLNLKIFDPMGIIKNNNILKFYYYFRTTLDKEFIIILSYILSLRYFIKSTEYLSSGLTFPKSGLKLFVENFLDKYVKEFSVPIALHVTKNDLQDISNYNKSSSLVNYIIKTTSGLDIDQRVRFLGSKGNIEVSAFYNANTSGEVMLVKPKKDFAPNFFNLEHFEPLYIYQKALLQKLYMGPSIMSDGSLVKEKLHEQFAKQLKIIIESKGSSVLDYYPQKFNYNENGECQLKVINSDLHEIFLQFKLKELISVHVPKISGKWSDFTYKVFLDKLSSIVKKKQKSDVNTRNYPTSLIIGLLNTHFTAENASFNFEDLKFKGTVIPTLKDKLQKTVKDNPTIFLIDLEKVNNVCQEDFIATLVEVLEEDLNKRPSSYYKIHLGLSAIPGAAPSGMFSQYHDEILKSLKN